MSGSRIVTIKEIIPLYKGEEKANAIELVSLEEVGNSVVAQKDIYKPGDKALFIQPDYCLSDIEVFMEYIEPGGDRKKCKLGKNNRVRAIKFNLHTGNNEPVYSYGILLHQKVLNDTMKLSLTGENDFDKLLKIVKYEEPEVLLQAHESGKVVTCPFPQLMYQTDEENINNVINDIQFPIHLIGTHKSDGSSISVWYKNGKSGITSRKCGKPLSYKKVVGHEIKWWQKLLKALSFALYKPDGKIIKTVQSDDLFVVIGRPYLEKLVKYGQNIVLRGELVGKGSKGSGNSNNPKAKEDTHIEFFGIDDYNDVAKRFPYNTVEEIASRLDLQLVHKYFEMTFNDKNELLNHCQKIFNTEKENGKIIEGIVARNENGNFSCKIMNLEYDSRK